MSGHNIYYWRDSINNCLIRCINYAFGLSIQDNAQWQRSGITCYANTIDLRTRTNKNPHRKSREKSSSTITKNRRRLRTETTGNAIHLSSINPDDEGQYNSHSGEHEITTGDGGHPGIEHTIAGKLTEEITKQIEVSIESTLRSARSLRESVEAIRAEKLKWLLAERDRLEHG